jgi:hypothetical protein
MTTSLCPETSVSKITRGLSAKKVSVERFLFERNHVR